MKIKQTAFFLAVSILFTLTGYSAPEVAAGSDAQAQWNRADTLRAQGDLRAARKAFERFVKQWPEDPKAPAAKQAVGDIYLQQGKDSKAFEAYESLIQSYYTGVKDYDKVLEVQYEIAQRVMTRERMSWLFGGYTSPERAVPYLESILKNAPQWERAPEMQMQIGEAYRLNEKYHDAIAAYTTLEYRYPDSPLAEKAAVAKIQSLQELVRSTPYSEDIRAQAQIAANVFAATYPESENLKSVSRFEQELGTLAAKRDFEIAGFYERVPVPEQKDAARMYYEKVIRDHEGTVYAKQAAVRLRVMAGAGAAAGGVSAPLEDGSSATNRPDRGPLPERLTQDEEAIEMTADRMEYEGSVLVGEGNVAVQQEGTTLQADRMTVNPDTGDMTASGNVVLLQEKSSIQAERMTMNQKTGEITASGNVVVLQDGASWKGEELVYNFKTQVGDFGESDIYFEPAFIVAEHTERISTNEFLMYNARITTCEGDDPLIYAMAEEVRVLDEDKPSGLFVKAKKVTFYVGKVPVFYTPVWNRHLGYRVWTFVLGYGGDYGAFVKARAELHPKEGYIANSHFDYYSNRGVGLGQDLKWRLDEKPTKAELARAAAEAAGEEFDEEEHYKSEEPEYGLLGDLKTYYINDSSPYESADTAAEKAQVDSTRYRISFDHQDEINDSTYFMTRLNYLSDPFVLEDFFVEEFHEYANPENYAVLQYATNDYAASVRVDQRLNDFYTTVNRLPAVDYDRYLKRIGESRYFFESENNVGYYGKQYSDFDQILDSDEDATNDADRVTLPDYNSLRMDTYNTAYMPMRYKEFLNVIPRAAYRGTWYSETAYGGSANLRNIFELGTLTSFKAYKTLTQNEGFYGQGLHSVVEPYADYTYRFKPNLEPDDLYWFDEVDQLDAANEVQFGVRNFIQTKRGEKRIANFFESDVFTTLRFDPLEDENTMGPLEADATLRLTDHFYLKTDFEFEWEEAEFSSYNFSGSYQSENQNLYSLSYRYVQDDYMLITPRVLYRLNEKWFYDLYAQYDVELGEWRDRSVKINRTFDCLSVGVGARIDDDDETTIYLQCWLTGFPGSAIGPGQ
jgi:LPS-assembly protein